MSPATLTSAVHEAIQAAHSRRRLHNRSQWSNQDWLYALQYVRHTLPGADNAVFLSVVQAMQHELSSERQSFPAIATEVFTSTN